MTAVISEFSWTERELRIFSMEDFAGRMTEIRAQIQPKLRAIGERLREPMNQLCGQPCYPHVAKHLRRTVNPPPETWVAFSPSPRGYKQYCHYAFVVSLGGVHARIIVNSEAPDRIQQAERLRHSTGNLMGTFQAVHLRCYEPWDCQGLPVLVDHSEKFWQQCADRLSLKTGGLDLGIGFAGRELTTLTEAKLIVAFEQLQPLYRVLIKQ
ncbi:MAG: DUF1054 family protein [Acidobacteriota bacterium]